MTKKQLELKIQELNPEKTYLIIVGEKSGLTPETLRNIPKDKLGKKTLFLMVQDVNDIKVEELDALQEYIDYHKSLDN